MNRTYVRFPNFKRKAVTLSYDDGVRQDKRLIEIMKKHGLKGTFNINGAMFSETCDNEDKGRLTKEEAISLYCGSDMEVAVHGYRHISLAKVDAPMATNDVLLDRIELEKTFGKIINGMAYANGSYNDEVVDIVAKCGIAYARTVTSTERFDIPSDWLRLPATCHHNNPRLMELARAFVESENAAYYWRNSPQMFYLWGHSYEFDTNDNWHVIEEFAEYIGGRDDIWYATNGEIYSYLQAASRLVFSISCDKVYNPSCTDVYINYLGKERMIPAGQTVTL
ncbi:MAG: polysaccharide deacetylase family protein [Clostridia bacterium]|nr:polysaccharide deacetylase family protein [Clostridia bacterium]